MKLKCRLEALIQGVEQKYNIKFLGILYTVPLNTVFRGSNAIGQINIIIDKMFIFNISFENPLQTMTAWSLELIA